MAWSYGFAKIWLCLNLTIWHIVEVDFVDIRLILVLFWAWRWVVMGSKKKLLSRLGICDLLDYVWARWRWLPHLRLAGIPCLPHLMIQDILTVTLLRSRCHGIIPAYLLKLLALTYARLVLLSCEALSPSALTLSCGSSRLISTLYNLSMVPFKEILPCWLRWSTLCGAIVKLIILLVDATVSHFTLGLFASAVTDKVRICLPKACFGEIWPIWTSLRAAQLGVVPSPWNILSHIADNFSRANIIVILHIYVIIDVVWHVLRLVSFVPMTRAFALVVLVGVTTFLRIRDLTRLLRANNDWLGDVVAV